METKLEPPHVLLPLVAVVMATYDPSIEWFRVQVESIRAQTYTRWRCVISDDGSSPDVLRQMEEVLGDDPRFRLDPNVVNLGFYRNFERALSLVPAGTTHVALADQDDRWYPDKLQMLLDSFGPTTTLAYSDVRLVDRSGHVLAETYWTNRSNNHTDLQRLMMANTVTGAASLFLADLLPDLLPFPSEYPSSFHDHWIAVVAAAQGDIAYVARPLHDYVQHGTNVIGHAARRSGRGLGRRVRGLTPRGLLASYRHMGVVFRGDCLRLQECARLILERSGTRLRPGAKRELRPFATLDSSKLAFIWFALRAALSLADDRVTMGAERRLFFGLVWSRLDYVRRRLRGTHLTAPAWLPRTEDRAEEIAQKIAPLRLQVDEVEPRRINFLLPAVDIEHFFGGYIGKFNLALALTRRGHRVRMVCVDAGSDIPSDWRERLSGYAGLSSIPVELELVSCADRQQLLRVHPHDDIIASTWWTAHIAREAAASLTREGFLYLVQEYEPMTFEHGALHALADETYDFPHRALFSTELLRDWFAEEGKGVFSAGQELGRQRSQSFENAITDVGRVEVSRLAGRRPRRVLFYARPEPHAARNMYDFGLLALRRAVADGVFDQGAWEFHGIGSSKALDVPLGQGRVLSLLPRQDQTRYARVLAAHDVGLSLMYTPHPSLVPLEMASAGMITITNTFATKTAQRLEELSPNLLAVEPTVEGVVEGLARAVQGVDDVEARAAGAAATRWSRDWSDSLSDDLLARLENHLEELRGPSASSIEARGLAAQGS